MDRILENPQLQRLLSQLEDAIDPEVEERLYQEWLDFTCGHFQGDVFLPERQKTLDIEPAVPAPHINDTLDGTPESYVNMLLSQYRSCLGNLRSGNGALLNVRSNYGVVIMPSLFGCRTHIMPREQSCLPTSIALSKAELEAIPERGVPSLTGGYGAAVFAMGALYQEVGLRYPKIGRYVHVYQPDMQGPLDICELLWGAELFYDLYDQPELVHAVLDVVCDTYTAFMNKWLELFPAGEYNIHSGMMIRGAIRICDDSAMNLSEEMFREFILPYDQRLLHRFGSGFVHFCGHVDHYIASCTTMEGLYAVNMTQPELNDMETVFRHTVDKGIRIIGLARSVALEHAHRLNGLVCSQYR